MSIERATYTCTVNGHSKFWSYEWDTTTKALTTKFGRIGTTGQSSMRSADSAALNSLVQSKLSKGYTLVPGSTSTITTHRPSSQDYHEKMKQVSEDLDEELDEPVRTYPVQVNGGGAALRRRRNNAS